MFLMFIACVGAFILGEYTEGALVLLLFQLGEFLQDLILAIVYLLPVIIIVIIILVILRPFFSKWNAGRKEKKAAKKALKAEKASYSTAPKYPNPFRKKEPEDADRAPESTIEEEKSVNPERSGIGDEGKSE